MQWFIEWKSIKLIKSVKPSIEAASIKHKE